MKDIVTLFSEQYSETLETQMPLQDYRFGCSDNPVMYASVAERMLTAIGHAELMDTFKDSHLSLIFQNRTMKYYEGPRTSTAWKTRLSRSLDTFVMQSKVWKNASKFCTF